MICEICKQEVENIGYHARQTHKISSEEYYRKYLMKPNEGKCVICGGDIKFKSITKGFGSNTCSPRCFLLKKSKDKEFQDKRIEGIREFFSDEKNHKEFSERTKIQMSTEESRKRSRGTMRQLREDEVFMSKRKSGHEAYWGNPENHKLQSERAKIQMQDTEIRASITAGTKKLWEDPNRREDLIKKIKDYNSTPERKEKQREQIKGQWKDPKFAETVKSSAFKLWKTPLYRAKMEELWANPEFKQKCSDKMKAQLQDEAFIRANRKATWENPEFRQKIRESCTAIEIYGYRFSSALEVSFWLFCVVNDIIITRNEYSYEYFYNGTKHFCTYDFKCLMADGTNIKVEVKGDHINGHCVYSTFDDEQYAIIRQTYIDNGVMIVTEEELKKLGMPTSRKDVFEYLRKLEIPFKEN